MQGCKTWLKRDLALKETEQLTELPRLSFYCLSPVKPFALWVINSTKYWEQILLTSYLYDYCYTHGPRCCSICDTWSGYFIFRWLTADRGFMKMFYTFTVRPSNHGETSKSLFQRPNESQQSATHTTCLLPVPPPCSLALAFNPSHIPLVLSYHASSSVSWQLAGRGLGSQRPEPCMQASNPAARILAAQILADGLTCPKLLSWTPCSCATQLLHITP